VAFCSEIVSSASCGNWHKNSSYIITCLKVFAGLHTPVDGDPLVFATVGLASPLVETMPTDSSNQLRVVTATLFSHKKDESRACHGAGP
jgi:hypothetical protein